MVSLAMLYLYYVEKSTKIMLFQCNHNPKKGKWIISIHFLFTFDFAETSENLATTPFFPFVQE